MPDPAWIRQLTAEQRVLCYLTTARADALVGPLERFLRDASRYYVEQNDVIAVRADYAEVVRLLREAAADLILRLEDEWNAAQAMEDSLPPCEADPMGDSR